MKKSELIAALAAIPGDPEILVHSAEVGYDDLKQLSMVTVQKLNPFHCRLGSGEFVAHGEIAFLQECETYRTEPRIICADAPFEALAIYRGQGKRKWD